MQESLTKKKRKNVNFSVEIIRPFRYNFKESTFLCLVITHTPTDSPTSYPTTSPTSTPTFEPTLTPVDPTPRPTHDPIFGQGTDPPTLEPTFTPTIHPTNISLGIILQILRFSIWFDFFITYWECTTVSDWTDRDGDDCETYGRYCDFGVPKYGPDFYEGLKNPNTNLTALDACCICGGGLRKKLLKKNEKIKAKILY